MIDIYVSIINGSTVDFSDITNNEFKVIDALKQRGTLSNPVIANLRKLDLHIWKNYGSSETSGPYLLANEKGWFDCNKNPKVSVLPTGELKLSGKNIFMGYLCDEKKTSEAIDKDSCFHSGDFILKDKNGFRHVMSSKTEIVSADGKPVSPLEVEKDIKSLLSFVRYAMIIEKQIKSGIRAKFRNLSLRNFDKEKAAEVTRVDFSLKTHRIAYTNSP
ncbi:hypothetical protein QYM36_006946 [Artemia franciscana]|uniref:AMP-dependent synthetase/ligase domain-containing protein n=1 Tax=Artemia franciscana TaxID=6661 RepID=A0AA88L8T0_ARTSF|nr:hypothetical protein QYM36_006946 [Artemia franciscana]